VIDPLTFVIDSLTFVIDSLLISLVEWSYWKSNAAISPISDCKYSNVE